MKAFVVACVAALAISIGAWAALDSLGMSSKSSNTVHGGSVRLD
jgi:hypothetical protein